VNRATDGFAGRLKTRIADFDEAGTGYWRVKALLADGRVFARVYITSAFVLGFPDLAPFHIADIVDVAWDSHHRGDSEGGPTEIVSTAPVSPWADLVVLPGPDGRRRATIFGAIEIAMGGPTIGTLMVNGGGAAWQVDAANPSMAWSEDSRRLAVPIWKGHVQRLAVLDADSQSISVGKDEYRVMKIERFAGGIVRGIDSPAHMPLPFDVRV
jgi:hypothetical protein